MECGEVKEYVSALHDRETVPPYAAEHMARCADCQELLKRYAEMGAKLHSYGNLLIEEPVPDRTWLKTGGNKFTVWEKGLQMMRIPRIAFACLVLLLVILSSRLALVEVRAHENGSVLLLKLTPAQGDSLSCNLSMSDTDHNSCWGLAQIDPAKANLIYNVKALRKDGSRVLLSIRSKVTPLGPASDGPGVENSMPEIQSWFTPGEALSVPGTGDLNVVLTGQWADHIPVTLGSDQLLDPGPNEIRLSAPLLLKNNKVVGDMAYASAVAGRPDEGAFLLIPGEGRFLLLPMPVAGAVPAKVQLNRISFESDGQSYVIVTGMPVSRREKIWVLHDKGYKSSPEAGQVPVIGAAPISKLLSL
jgi:hypothetical protein